jgi:hypothetical protein
MMCKDEFFSSLPSSHGNSKHDEKVERTQEEPARVQSRAMETKTIRYDAL